MLTLHLMMSAGTVTVAPANDVWRLVLEEENDCSSVPFPLAVVALFDKAENTER